MTQEWFLIWLLLIGLFLMFVAAKLMNRVIGNWVRWFMGNRKQILAEAVEDFTWKQGIGLLFKGSLPMLQEVIDGNLKKMKDGL